jgi:hypothetical protein
MDYPDEHEVKIPAVGTMRSAMKPYVEQLAKQITSAVPAEDIAKIAKQISVLQSELATHKELTKEDVHSIVDKSVNKLANIKKSEPVKKKSLQDEILKFRPHDQDPSENVGFYGFVHPSGAYYIVRHDVKEGKQRYYVGKGDYEAAWGKRERLKGYGLLSDQWGE